MENLVEQIKEMKKMGEAMETIQNKVMEEINTLETEVKETSEEIMELSKETATDLDNVSVEEYLNIETVDEETNTKRITFEDGETLEYQATETKFDKISDDATDEEIEAAFAKFEVKKDEYKDLDKEQQIALLNYFLEKEALALEMKKMEEEFQAKIKEFNEELTKETLEGTKENVLNVLKKKRDVFVEYNQTKAVKEMDKLIDELLLSLTLENIKANIKSQKTKSNILLSYNDSAKFDEKNKTFYKKLARNKKYKFMYFENLDEYVMKNYGLNETETKLFLYTFFGYAHNEKVISKYSVFINEVIKNIIKPDSLTEEQYAQFKAAMLSLNEHVRA